MRPRHYTGRSQTQSATPMIGVRCCDAKRTKWQTVQAPVGRRAAVLMVMLDAKQSLRAIAASGGAPSTLSRNWRARWARGTTRASAGRARRDCGTSHASCPSSAWVRCCSGLSSTGCVRAGRPNRLPDDSRRSTPRTWPGGFARDDLHRALRAAARGIAPGTICLRQSRKQRRPRPVAWTGADKSLIWWRLYVRRRKSRIV